MEKNIRTIVFEIGDDPKDNRPKNYVKRLLAKHSCTTTQQILINQDLSTEQKQDIHTFWTECGHRIREKLNDDIKLERILRKVLPEYSGQKITLYRGENKKRYEDQTIGFCWTPNKETAEMFARGLNSHTYGGLLLQYTFSPEQIISGPSNHSIYLGEHEYTIAPSTINFDHILVLNSSPSVL